jgi:hypothetical protein
MLNIRNFAKLNKLNRQQTGISQSRSATGYETLTYSQRLVLLSFFTTRTFCMHAMRAGDITHPR